ncbi:hypothetical protein M0R45_036342 [Rubus argutus]|uniref:Uncharacterized protein n=1 Tax=Rubus argutus TaxID=59490 RepID=A0AAW1VX92_RUBAR
MGEHNDGAGGNPSDNCLSGDAFELQPQQRTQSSPLQFPPKDNNPNNSFSPNQPRATFITQPSQPPSPICNASSPFSRRRYCCHCRSTYAASPFTSPSTFSPAFDL